MFSFRKSGINITTRKNDEETLRKKLSAYRIFEVWLEKLVCALADECDRNDTFYRYIRRHYKKTFMASLVVEILRSSSVSAIFSNIRLYFQLKCVPFFKGVYWLFRELVKRMFLYVKTNV